MIEFVVEPYSFELIQEMIPLWVKHHNEVHQVNADLKPDLKMYEALGHAGVLRIFTARMEKVLVGYQVLTITKHPHFRDMRQAVMDILYLSPESRLGWMGYQFIRFVDQELKKEGVDLMFRSISARNDFGPVLERMGYELTDLSFMRVL